METKVLVGDIVRHINEVIAQSSDQGKALWKELIGLHPADIAQVCTYLKEEDILGKLFLMFPKEKQLDVFEELPNNFKEKVLDTLDDQQKSYILRHTPTDDLTDLFDTLSDEELKKYLEVLNKKDRQNVLSLLKFPPDSAGGIMTIDIITLMQDFTVSRSISLLQRLKPNIDLHRQIYVTDHEHKLVGYINLEDLLTRSPQRKLLDIVHNIPYVALVQEDQEEVAQKMLHYGMMTVPVVNDKQYLLGVITDETLIDVIQQEASEDVQRMSAAPVTVSYFEMPFFQLLYQRSFILGLLLILESLTSIIIGRFEAVLSPFLVMFLAMLTSTGGNTSSQTSAIAIQALASGDVNQSNMNKFVRREFLIGLLLGTVLSLISFARVYSVHHDFIGSLVVSVSLGLIVLLSVLLGSLIPIVLKRTGLDPVFSAGPFLATVMDILGIFIYCYIAYLVLS